MRSSISLATFGFVLNVACSFSAPESTAHRELAVIGGDADVAHANVVSIETTPDASSPELCSGVVIAPRVVLTAGHCTLGQDAGSIVVGVGASAGRPDRTLAVASVVTYPGFSGSFDDVQAGLDLGAVILAEDAGVPSATLFERDVSALVGTTATVVGFGQSLAADLETRGTRREADVRVVGACSALVSFGDATTNACHGDSGGAIFAHDSGGGESLAAIVSYGDELHCVTPTYAVRVDRYAGWIASIVAGADAAACVDCPARANDCTSVDAGSDAASADASNDSSDGGGASSLSANGGCSTSARASLKSEAPASGGAGRALLLALACVAALRRHRPAS